MAYVKIAGIASSLPEKAVTNLELEKLVDTSDEWIRKRTGIANRHVVTHETTTGMAADAARQAIQNSGIDPGRIGLIVGCTITGDYVTPSLASCVQRELGISSCAAMDISAGCTGFVYALVTASNLMETLGADAALVVAGEALSKYVDWSDRASCVLFGDGAGAVVLQRSEEEHVCCPVLSGAPDTGMCFRSGASRAKRPSRARSRPERNIS